MDKSDTDLSRDVSLRHSTLPAQGAEWPEVAPDAPDMGGWRTQNPEP